MNLKQDPIFLFSIFCYVVMWLCGGNSYGRSNESLFI